MLFSPSPNSQHQLANDPPMLVVMKMTERGTIPCVGEARKSINGGSVDPIVTVWVQDEELPEKSVVVQVTKVTPVGKSSGASFVIVGAVSLISKTIGSPRSTGIPLMEPCSIIMSEGQIIVGGTSTTVMVCFCLLILPWESL